MRVRTLWTVEVFEEQQWRVKAVSTSPSIAKVSFDSITKGRRTRMNEYTYDELDFLWTHARDCVTLEKSDETGTLS